MKPGFGTNDDLHRKAAERQAVELLAEADFTAKRGGIDFLVTLQTYTLELIGPTEPKWRGTLWTPLLRETEENLTDLLPDGYSVRIKEWDEADESWKSGLWRNTR